MCDYTEGDKTNALFCKSINYNPMKKILFIITVALCTVSCNDWLDIRPETEQKDYDQFSSVNGFYDALTGCYMTLASEAAYGERLSMSNIESLANYWYMPDKLENFTRKEDWELSKHDYTADYARSAIKIFYGGLFKAIVQANMILKYAEVQGDVFTDKAALAVVRGEAYAIRALCQFDLLRLFGQMPKNPAKQVELPYSYTTSIDEMPSYYDFTAYVNLLKEDLTKALSLLKDNDPVFEYTFEELNKDADVPHDHLLFRQSCMNYWAVKALQARLHLYLGETADAYRVAKEIIDATGPDGKPVLTMSGVKDFAAGYKLCPNECLFYLSKYNVMTNSETFLLGNQENARFGNSELVLTHDMFEDLYTGEQTASHNRFNNCWNQKVQTNTGEFAYVATTKYYFGKDVKNAILYYQLIPMLRMSEIYLIAMETSGDLSEVNGWYKAYMVAHAVGTSTDFASLDDARKWIIGEYRREFVAEGQMFYTYKRTGATEMAGRKNPVGESDYILPLPETEYNPNHLQK